MLAKKLIIAIKEQRRRIVVIGDTMIDRWVQGHAEPCQDGCHKFISEVGVASIMQVPGGAANAARSICHWNVDASLWGYGMDDCPVKTRYVDKDGKIVFRVDSNEQPKRGEERTYCLIRDLAMDAVMVASGVLLSDYDKGFLPPEFIAEVSAVCRKRAIPCVADCKRAPDVYAGCIMKANGAWGVKYIEDFADRSDATYVETHCAMYPGTRTSRRWNVTEIPNLPPVKCVNHVGAGDCFAAHLTLALSYGFSLKEAAALAHSAGRVYVQHPYNRPPLPSEVAADLSSAV